MWLCHYCKIALPLSIQKKNRLCPSCGSDIHCCKNCIFFDDSASSKCKEPNSPWVSDRHSQNNCHYFEFKVSETSSCKDSNIEEGIMLSEAEKAKLAFKALFKNSA